VFQLIFQKYKKKNLKMEYSSFILIFVLKIFNAVARSILCYGAQVWGFQYSETIELLLRFFIKKVFSMPTYTPNFIVYLETGLAPMFVHSLKLHLKYIDRLSKLSPDRLPYILGKEAFQRQIFWYKGLREVEETYNLDLFNGVTAFERLNLKDSLERALTGLKSFFNNKFADAASNSSSRRLYPMLSPLLQPSNNYVYIYKTSEAKWILKIRGELLDLNYKPWKQPEDSLCTLCNMNVIEDTFHFLAVCPALGDFRAASFGLRKLSAVEALNFANGKDWQRLISYAKSAWKFRTLKNI